MSARPLSLCSCLSLAFTCRTYKFYRVSVYLIALMLQVCQGMHVYVDPNTAFRHQGLEKERTGVRLLKKRTVVRNEQTD